MRVSERHRFIWSFGNIFWVSSNIEYEHIKALSYFRSHLYHIFPLFTTLFQNTSKNAKKGVGANLGTNKNTINTKTV